jgi:hypothetical protein
MRSPAVAAAGGAVGFMIFGPEPVSRLRAPEITDGHVGGLRRTAPPAGSACISGGRCPGLRSVEGTCSRLRVASRITNRHTEAVAKAISVRLDDDAERALRALEATGLTRSDAIRSSLLASAARLRRGQELAAEAAALEADEADRAEMLEVASLMESLRAPG